MGRRNFALFGGIVGHSLQSVDESVDAGIPAKAQLNPRIMS